MKRLLLILTVSAMTVTLTFGQVHYAPPAGMHSTAPVEAAPNSKPETPMDWPWMGFIPLSISSPTGLAYDGQDFWVPDWYGSPSYLYRVDVATGAILGQIPAPSLWPGGITYDGSHLWVTDYIGGPQIFKVDPATGSIVTSYPIVYSYYWAGVAWDGQYLYYGTNTGSPGQHYIYKIDPNTGTQLGTISVPSQDISGLTYYDGHLYYSDSETYMLYQITMDGAIVDSSPSYVTAWLGGVTIANGDLWNVDYSNDDIHQYDLGGVPNILVDLNLVSGSPVPPGGGDLHFSVFVENQGTSAVNMDAWLDTEYEGGPPTTLAQRYLAGFGVGWTINRPDMFYPVPSTWAGGNYRMFGRVGDHPGTVWAEDSFSFVKSGSYDGTEFTPQPVAGAPNPFDQIDKPGAEMPVETALMSCYPNPFNPSTVISYQLAEVGPVNLSIYDVTGRMVATIIDGWRDAGVHEVTFEASDLSAGVYIAHLTAGNQQTTQKLLLIK